MNWIKKNGTTLLLVLIFAVGAGLIAYPTFSDWWNSFHQSRAVASYAEAVANMNTEEYERSIREAQEYNQEISKTGIRWTLDEDEKETYEKMLSVGSSGIMGYIDIPKINITLPVYHGIDEKVLQVAIGHIPGSSLPVGGKGSHCIVSGHRGLPSARLFTDIDKIVEGDTFTLTVLNQTFTYEVDQIRTVLPTDLSDLQIEKGKDYCTLVTCTPYGINTHRLLVRGFRIANVNGDAKVIADALQIEPVYIAPFVAAPILVLLTIAVFFVTGNRRRALDAANAGREEADRIIREKGRRGH